MGILRIFFSFSKRYTRSAPVTVSPPSTGTERHSGPHPLPQTKVFEGSFSSLPLSRRPFAWPREAATRPTPRQPTRPKKLRPRRDRSSWFFEKGPADRFGVQGLFRFDGIEAGLQIL